jgi:hypothetical protein
MMKSIERLNSFDGSLKEELGTALVVTVMFILNISGVYIFSYISGVSDTVVIPAAIGITLLILCVCEDYFTELIDNYYKCDSFTSKPRFRSKSLPPSKTKQKRKTIVAKPHLLKTCHLGICLDIKGVILPIRLENGTVGSFELIDYSSEINSMIEALNKLVKLFGTKYVHLIDSGTQKEEWVTKAWLEKHNIINKSGISRLNIHFIRSDNINSLSEIDCLKAQKCKKLGISHYVDDRESALQIVSHYVNHVTLFTDSNFELACLNNSLSYYKSQIQYCNNWHELYKIIFKSVDGFYNRKTRFPKKNEIDRIIESYPFSFEGGPDGGNYVAIPVDGSEVRYNKQNLDDIAFVLITNNSDSDWMYQGKTPEAGYISYAGEILFTNDDYHFVK